MFVGREPGKRVRAAAHEHELAAALPGTQHGPKLAVGPAHRQLASVLAAAEAHRPHASSAEQVQIAAVLPARLAYGLATLRAEEPDGAAVGLHGEDHARISVRRHP